VGVAVGGFHFHHAVAHFQQRHVEGAAAQVEDQDDLVGLLVEPVGQRGRGRLVDDAQHFQPGDLAGVFGGLALAVVEVGRHGNDGLGHRLAGVGLGVALELAEDHGRNFLRGVGLAGGGQLDERLAVAAGDHLIGHHVALFGHFVEAAAHEALDGVNGVISVDDGLALGGQAHQAFAVAVEGDYRRQQARALGRGDNGGVAAFHDGHHRVGGTEVDTDDFSH
jgi:hypothetical protein